jgi:hypothetical protein
LREFEGQTGLNPRVSTLLEFLHRRNQGKHGRYLESQRAKGAEAAATTAAATPAARRPAAPASGAAAAEESAAGAPPTQAPAD